MLLKISIIIFYFISIVSCLSFTVTSKIYIDVKISRKPAGRIVFGLFGKDAPKAVENFRQICLNGINGKTYIGTKFHRIINRFIIQGGDIVSNDGFGSMSIYGKYFNDEALHIEHNRPGYLGMANRGPNTNGCQFYITTVAAQWLNGKHTVFGKVLEGMKVVQKIESIKTDTEDKPMETINISNCGEIPTEHYEYYPDDYNVWSWILATGPALGMSFIVLGVFHYFYRQLNLYC